MDEIKSQSPSGKYSLVVKKHSTKPGCWDYSVGTIYKNGKILSEIHRNYPSFPHAWIESHELDSGRC